MFGNVVASPGAAAHLARGRQCLFEEPQRLRRLPRGPVPQGHIVQRPRVAGVVVANVLLLVEFNCGDGGQFRPVFAGIVGLFPGDNIDDEFVVLPVLIEDGVFLERVCNFSAAGGGRHLNGSARVPVAEVDAGEIALGKIEVFERLAAVYYAENLYKGSKAGWRGIAARSWNLYFQIQLSTIMGAQLGREVQAAVLLSTARGKRRGTRA